MTCVVAIKDNDTIWMGSDSLQTWGDYFMDEGEFKIVRVGDVLIGARGLARNIRVIRLGLEVPEHPPAVDIDTYVETHLAEALRSCLKAFKPMYVHEEEERVIFSEFLIGYRGNLYKMPVEGLVYKVVENYCAIGEGRDVAMGSLYTTQDLSFTPHERIEIALSAAEQFVNTVRKPFHIIHLI